MAGEVRGTSMGSNVRFQLSTWASSSPRLCLAHQRRKKEKGRRSFLQPVDYARDALSHHPFAKIDNKRELKITEPQVRESLGFEEFIVGDRCLAAL